MNKGSIRDICTTCETIEDDIVKWLRQSGIPLESEPSMRQMDSGFVSEVSTFPPCSSAVMATIAF